MMKSSQKTIRTGIPLLLLLLLLCVFVSCGSRNSSPAADSSLLAGTVAGTTVPAATENPAQTGVDTVAVPSSCPEPTDSPAAKTESAVQPLTEAPATTAGESAATETAPSAPVTTVAITTAAVSVLPVTTASVTTAAPVTAETPAPRYYVRAKTDGAVLNQTPEYLEYTDLNAARQYCDTNARYGCIVCDQNYQCIYAPCGEAASEILYQAKRVCDFIRDDSFRYGNAPINPGFDYSAHLVSCDRMVDWVLYRVGFTDQPYQNGKCVSGPWLTNWCIAQGFTRIENLSDVKPGDIVFVNPNQNGDPLHVFLCAGGGPGNYYRYDAGSDTRIQSTQPFYEPISNFMYAYRAAELPNTPGFSYEEAPEIPKFDPNTQYTEMYADNFDGELRWTAVHDISGLRAEDGVLKMTCSGGDPYFVYNGTLDLSCSEVNTMRVRIQNGSSNTVFQVFFITDTTPNYTADAMVSVSLVCRNVRDFDNAGWEEAEIDLSSNKLWKGTLKGIRIDPIASIGEVRFDSISLGKTEN